MATPDPLSSPISPAVRYAVVVPTVGRASLSVLLSSLARQGGPAPEEVVVVDDRPEPTKPLPVPAAVTSGLGVTVLRTFGMGPAAARNRGWRATRSPWVVFLDDDVVLTQRWAHDLVVDLRRAADDVAGTQGRLVVPLPTDRRPTDWERSTAGLEGAEWATADMAYRRAALAGVGGFDERFPRAYREDADLALRVRERGWSLAKGSRRTLHPVRPAPDSVSVRVQRGNRDDALMRRLHGKDWRDRAGTGRGRLPWHAATVLLAGSAAVVPLVRRGGVGRGLAAAAALGWAALTVEFARIRIAPGPREPREVWKMAWTSVVIPFAAVWHRAAGEWQHRAAPEWARPARAVLFDRDGTLVHDVPYNADPTRVVPVPGAAEAVGRLRRAGVKIGVVSNQSGVARGLVSEAELASVNRAVEQHLGPFDTWRTCPHGPEDGCSCRKPRPGMVLEAARDLGVRAADCVVIGDIGADVGAAEAAGARGILVPTPATRPEEVAEAAEVADNLTAAVSMVLGSPHGR